MFRHDFKFDMPQVFLEAHPGGQKADRDAEEARKDPERRLERRNKFDQKADRYVLTHAGRVRDKAKIVTSNTFENMSLAQSVAVPRK